MRHIKCIVVFTSFAFAQFFIFGQKNDPVEIKRCPVKTLGTEQGLLNVTTNSIVTDSLGFTWVSTRIGLQRYNGYILENINPVINKDTILINTPVFLFGLQNGSVWISYKKGILEYSPATNSFKKIASIPASAYSFFATVPLKQTEEGIWCMQENKGVVIYRNGGFYPKENDSATIHAINVVIGSEDILTRKIIAANGNYIFIRLNATQLLQISTQTLQFDCLNNFDGDIIGLGCTADRLFVATIKSLCSYIIAKHALIKEIPIKSFYNDYLTFSCVEEYESNYLLISTNGQLFEFDTALQYHRTVTTLSKDPIGRASLKHQIYVDKMKRVWLLTNNDIAIVRNTEIPFQHFIYPSEKSNSVRCIYYDKQKHLILAGCINSDTGRNGGIRLFDTLSNPLWKKPIAAAEGGSINAIEKLNNNYYLVIAFDRHGWFLMNLEEKKIFPLAIQIDEQTKTDLYANQWINNLQRIDDTTLYIASPVNIFRCIFKNNKLTGASPLLPFKSNSSNSISCFIYTSDQTLWAATNSGLIYRFKKNKQLENIQINGGYTIRCFAQDSMKHIWVGTDKGINIYAETGQLLKTIVNQSGLLNDYIYAILPMGDSSSAFVSTNMGLSFVSLNGEIKNYTKEFGLQSNEFYTESAAKTETGKLYFGGVNGINSFYPDALSEVKDTPLLNVTRLVVNDSLLSSSTGSWIGDTLSLNHSQNHIQLDFAALGLLNTDEYTYTYRLTNFEESWQTTHQPTGIKYTLSPGKYLLEVKCSPILSPGTIFYKKINIIIYPPWWQTWWVRFIALLTLIAVISLIVWQYNRRKFAQKIRELQVQHEIQHERERISRDLHDNLGAYAAAIAANISKVKETSQTSKMMDELQHNSQAIVTQLNDTIWALNCEAISITSISDRFKIFLQKIQPSYQQINIDVKESIVTDISFSPANALHLFRIMQEAVNNAARHSNGRNIQVSIKSNASWLVSIIDDGDGLKDDAGKTSGNGLRNMQLRASEAGWDICWDDEEPHGTRFTIIPKPGSIL